MINIALGILAVIVLGKIVWTLKDKLPALKLPSLKTKLAEDKANIKAGVGGLIDKIYTTAILARESNETILKELNGTFERVITIKLSSPEGCAEIEQKLVAAKKIAEVAVPLAVKAAVVLL